MAFLIFNNHFYFLCKIWDLSQSFDRILPRFRNISRNRLKWNIAKYIICSEYAKIYPAKRFYESLFAISTPEILAKIGQFSNLPPKKKMVLEDLTSNLVAWNLLNSITRLNWWNKRPFTCSCIWDNKEKPHRWPTTNASK